MWPPIGQPTTSGKHYANREDDGGLYTTPRQLQAQRARSIILQLRSDSYCVDIHFAVMDRLQSRKQRSMEMLKEFKEFALKGNVLDMAVGIIIGAAFTTIVTSLVDDILMPPIGVILGGLDFSNYFLNLSGTDVASVSAAKDAGVPVIAYGNFINAVIKFLIVAFALFLVVKNINNLKKMMEREEEAKAETAPPPRQEVLLEEIRDIMKSSRA